jgi:hypothetical protein
LSEWERQLRELLTTDFIEVNEYFGTWKPGTAEDAAKLPRELPVASSWARSVILTDERILHFQLR